MEKLHPIEKVLFGYAFLESEFADVLKKETDIIFTEQGKKLQEIFNELSNEGQAIDMITTANKLRNQGILEEYGGLKGLDEMSTKADELWY